MPSVRNVILLSVLILMIALGAACWSMLQPPDSGGMGRDSYGTQAFGFRAIYEVLGESGLVVSRELTPPRAGREPGTIALIHPDVSICESEPVYLRSLLPWIDQGGTLVVAIGRVSRSEEEARKFRSESSGIDFPTIWETLELDGVAVQVPDAPIRYGAERSFTEEVLENWARNSSSSKVIPVRSTGGYISLLGPRREVSLPAEGTASIAWEEIEPVGTLTYTNADDEEPVIAAEFARGEGRIVVIADASLLNNRHISQADNPIIAARLLARTAGPVVFDEFYHGLGVRGNPLYLLTIPGYAATGLSLLLSVCIASWRAAILLGPSLADPSIRRRDIGEYVAAMGQFFARGRSSRPFLVARVRQGVLRELCMELSLPPETEDVDRIVTALSRKSPGRADNLRRSIADVDAAMEHQTRWTESQTVDAMRRLTACL